MRNLLAALFLAFCGLMHYATPAQAQPCQWNYTAPNNRSLATYCGDVQVNGQIIAVPSNSPQAYGAVCDGTTDDHVALQNWLNSAGSLQMVSGKICRNASGNLLGSTSTTIFIPAGAELLLDTTRLSWINKNDAHIFGNGLIQSINLNTTDTLPTDWAGRGIVEFGGTIASPANNFSIENVTVQGDFSGTPGTITIIPADRRRGILQNNAINSTVKNVTIGGTIAEAIFENSAATGSNADAWSINWEGNFIHDCNHDALSADETVIGPSLRIANNYGRRCLNGIESNTGLITGNTMENMVGSAVSFGGNAPGPGTVGAPTVISNNVGRNNGAADFDLEGSTAPQGALTLNGNTSYNPAAGCFTVSYINDVNANGNTCIGYGQSIASSGISVFDNLRAKITGSYVANPGASANENYNVLRGTVAGAVAYFGNDNVSIGAGKPYSTNMLGGNNGLLSPLTPVFSLQTPFTLTGTTGTTALVTWTIPAGQFGIMGCSKVVAGGAMTGNGGTKTLSVNLGAANFMNQAIPIGGAAWRVEVEFCQLGATNSQSFNAIVYFANTVVNTLSGVTSANLSGSTSFSLAGTLASGADSMSITYATMSPEVGQQQ